MENFEKQLEGSYVVPGLLVGGFAALGTTIGGLLGFFLSGGIGQFLSQGWAWTIFGVVAGSLLSSSIGLIAFALHIRKIKNSLSQ
ncbi:MAG: hypothetical protein FWC69_02105 [Defluviitaleaceae bacterium]|nr:hypothetical protein [Defluviitaleaceae bacterium]